jgi:hypothetical protein
MAKLSFRRSGTTYSSLLAGSSSGLLVNTGGVTLGASSTTGSVPVGGNYLQYSKSGSTYNVFLNNNYTTWTALALNLPTGITCTNGSLVYAKSIFVLFSDNGAIYTSPTGTGSWTVRKNSRSNGGVYDGPMWLTFFGGRFFAQGSYDDPEAGMTPSILLNSFDGITWTVGTGSIGEFGQLYNYDGTTSYVSVIGGGANTFWKSTDEGATYTSIPNIFPSNPLFKFAGSYYGISSYNFVKWASNWSSFSGVGGTNPLGGSAFNYYIHNNYYSNEKMLIFSSGATYYYSNDLVNWTTGTWPNGTASRSFWSANGLTYMNNGTSTTNCYVTVDGINWTLVSMTGGVSPYNSVSISGAYVGSQLQFNRFFTLHQAGQIGVFSGVNKLIVRSWNSNYTVYTIYVSDGT